jgi:lysophospholipase L1-like esterase
VSEPELGRSKRALFAALLAACVLVAIELLLQLAYRVQAGAFLFERTLVPLYAAAPDYCYGLAPNLALEHRTSEFSIRVFTNERGLRSDASRRSVPYERTPGVARILYLGPSFTFGWGVDHEQTFVERAGQALVGEGRRVEWINAGVPGHGSEHQLCWLRAEGWRYQPDLVVFNDYASVGAIVDRCPEPLACPVVEDGYVYTQPPTLALRAVSWLKNLGVVFYAFQAQRLIASDAPAEATTMGKELRTHEALVGEARDPDLLARRFAGFTAFVRLTLGREVPVLFLYVPLAFVVHPEDLPRWRHFGFTDAEGPRLDTERRIGWLRERGIPIVDATPKLAARAARERTYYWLDIHLTPAGNEAVAEALRPALEASLPAAPGAAAQPPSSAPSPASSSTSTPSSRARSSLLPGSEPATT